ncbi:MAG: FABP family protein, partial [Mycobacterium sp.]
SGRGSGDYPTIERFDYVEDVVIGHTGKAFLTYSQRTRSTSGQPLHAEVGYIRMPGPGRVELVIAHPSGVAEIDEGTVTVDHTGLLIEVHSTAVALTTTAKDVAALKRSFRMNGDSLEYTLEMGAVGRPMQHHLSATLHRQS